VLVVALVLRLQEGALNGIRSVSADLGRVSGFEVTLVEQADQWARTGSLWR